MENSKQIPNLAASDPTRRKLITALLTGGFVLAVSPTAANAVTHPAPQDCALPTPADALSIYVDQLGAMGFAYHLLRPYFFITGLIAAELTEKYSRLRRNVDEFIQLTPGLRVNDEACRLRQVTDAGQASVGRLDNLRARNIPLVDSYSMAISFSSSALALAVDGLKGAPSDLTLTEAAVQKLKDIICGIESLQKPTDAIRKASKALTDNDKSLKERIDQIESTVRKAISVLVSAEIGRKQIGEAKVEAKALIDKAIDQSRNLEKFEVSEDLKNYLTQFKISNKSEAYAEPDVKPIEKFREFLSGVILWVQNDDWHSARTRGRDASFANAAFTNSAPIGIIGRIQEILDGQLPEGNQLRARCCYALVRIKFLLGFSGTTLLKEIAETLHYLWPKGDWDSDSTRRAAAAAELVKLPFN